MVYQDQIWHKSKCREFESSILKLFKSKNVPVMLVDAVDIANLTGTIVTDNILNRPHVGLYPEYWGSFSYNPTYISRPPTKLFNCFINRVCLTRQSWFYQFVRRDLLNKGSISFLLDYRTMPNGIVTKQELNDYIFNLGNQIFQAEHEQMKNHVPFCNFDELNLDQVIVDSCISVVIETYFDFSDTIAFSEKIFRALQLPRPFLLFSMPGSIAALKNYGFDIWEDIIDHSYDNEVNPIQRQILILDQLCKLQNISYNSKQLAEFDTRAQYNQNLLNKFRQEWPQKLKTVLEQLQR